MKLLTTSRYFVLLCLGAIALAQQVDAQFVRVVKGGVNIRTAASTNSSVVVQAEAGDVFGLEGKKGNWYEVSMFSGEYRYIHDSLAVRVDTAPPLLADEDVRRRACIEIVRAQDRAVAEAEEKFPNDYRRQIDLERLLYDRYELPVFRKYGISPARNSTLVVECAKKRWLP